MVLARECRRPPNARSCRAVCSDALGTARPARIARRGSPAFPACACPDTAPAVRSGRLSACPSRSHRRGCVPPRFRRSGRSWSPTGAMRRGGRVRHHLHVRAVALVQLTAGLGGAWRLMTTRYRRARSAPIVASSGGGKSGQRAAPAARLGDAGPVAQIGAVARDGPGPNAARRPDHKRVGEGARRQAIRPRAVPPPRRHPLARCSASPRRAPSCIGPRACVTPVILRASCAPCATIHPHPPVGFVGGVREQGVWDPSPEMGESGRFQASGGIASCREGCGRRSRGRDPPIRARTDDRPNVSGTMVADQRGRGVPLPRGARSPGHNGGTPVRCPRHPTNRGHAHGTPSRRGAGPAVCFWSTAILLVEGRHDEDAAC